MYHGDNGGEVPNKFTLRKQKSLRNHPALFIGAGVYNLRIVFNKSHFLW
jgi:hypothetical protein